MKKNGFNQFLLIIGGITVCIVCLAYYLFKPDGFSFNNTSDFFYFAAVLVGAAMTILGFFIFIKNKKQKSLAEKNPADCPNCGAKADADINYCCKYCGEKLTRL